MRTDERIELNIPANLIEDLKNGYVYEMTWDAEKKEINLSLTMIIPQKKDKDKSTGSAGEQPVADGD